MISGTKDRPWLFRTYAGHSTAAASNRLYRENLAKDRQVFRLLSTSRPRPDTTVTMSWPRAKSARLVFRSVTSATCGCCLTESRWNT